MEKSHFLEGLTLLLVFVINTNSVSLQIGLSHWNDVNGQIESYKEGTYNSTAAPEPCVTNQNECIGGIVSLTHWLFDNSLFSNIKENRIIRLSSGNLIGGESGWVSSIPNGWEMYADAIMKHYRPNFMALGMKEFGTGVQKTVNFLQAQREESNETLSVAFPVNTCQDSSYSGAEQEFCSNATTKIKTLEIPIDPEDGGGTYKIGVVGFVTPTVEQLSLPGKLKFEDVALSIKQEIDANGGSIKTFIAIGDGSLTLAEEIIDAAPQVKLVIFGAGLGNTLDMSDNYPMSYKDSYIVTAGRYGSSVGKLVLDLETTSGAITNAAGELVQTVYPSPMNEEGMKASQTFRDWKVEVTKSKEIFVGYSGVTLKGGEVCWESECNLGNLMTDAMIHCAMNFPETPYSFRIYSIWHGGAFFEDLFARGENITRFDIHKWLPFHNKGHLVSLLGSNLKLIFEISATGIDPVGAGVKNWRQFLQVSGFEVHYSTASGKPELTRIRVIQDIEGSSKLVDVQDNTRYFIVVPTYLYEGRGLYGLTQSEGFWGQVLVDAEPKADVEFDDAECLETFITAMKHAITGGARIFIDDNDQCES